MQQVKNQLWLPDLQNAGRTGTRLEFLEKFVI
jgi:hypothetical protein